MATMTPPLFKTLTGHATVTLQANSKPCVFPDDTGGGATLTDLSKKRPVSTLSPQADGDHAAGIGSATPLVRAAGMFGINRTEIQEPQPVPHGRILRQCRVQEDPFPLRLTACWGNRLLSQAQSHP